MASIYDTEPDEHFYQKVTEFDSLLWYAAKRFEIKGVLHCEDLYQEGLVALEETFDNHWTRHPDSPEFTRAFKSRLFHRMSEVLRRCKTQSRDWRKELHSLLDPDSEDDTRDILNQIPQTTFPPPDRGLELEGLQKYRTAIEDSLRVAARSKPCFSTLEEDAIELLHLVTDPDYEVPDALKIFYERVPSEGFSNAILAEITGWDVMHVRRALKRLRLHARQLATEYGLTITSKE